MKAHIRHASTRGIALAVSTLVAGLLFLIGFPPAAASASEGACIDGEGVTVVVDFTDLGGSIEAGCATGDPTTGRIALENAGFAATDSTPGMICAVGGQPDPCPATFEGSYWAYWTSTAGGEWSSYQVGADGSDPVPGDIEGWRYNDGSAAPGIAPADVASIEAVADSTGSAAADDSSAASAGNDDIVLFAAVGLTVLLAGLVGLFLVRARRRQALPED